MTDLEKTKARLLSQLVLLDSICSELVTNAKLHVATVRLEQWRNQTDEILLRLGKREMLDGISEMSAGNTSTPADKILEDRRKYRAFVLQAIKDADELNQANNESQTFLAFTD